MERYMRTKELAVYLSVTVPTVRAWMRRGYIPYSKVGKVALFDKEEVDKAIGSRLRAGNLKREGVAE